MLRQARRRPDSSSRIVSRRISPRNLCRLRTATLSSARLHCRRCNLAWTA
jgi:hypothetical protein